MAEVTYEKSKQGMKVAKRYGEAKMYAGLNEAERKWEGLKEGVEEGYEDAREWAEEKVEVERDKWVKRAKFPHTPNVRGALLVIGTGLRTHPCYIQRRM